MPTHQPGYATPEYAQAHGSGRGRQPGGLVVLNKESCNDSREQQEKEESQFFLQSQRWSKSASPQSLWYKQRKSNLYWLDFMLSACDVCSSCRL